MFLRRAARLVSSRKDYLENRLKVWEFNISRSIVAVAAEKYTCSELESAKPFDEIPRITNLPFIGSAWVYFPLIGRYSVSKLHEADFHKFKVYGDIVREKFGYLNVVSTFTPESMELLLQHEGKYPKRAELSTLKVYRELRKEWYKTGGVIVLEGKEWADLRRKTQKHLMKPRTIQAYLNPMQDVASDLIKRIIDLRDSNFEVPTILDELYKWSLESVAYVGFDTRLGCLKKNLPSDSDGRKMIESVQTQFKCMNKLEAFTGNVQIWKYFPTPTWKKYVKASDTFNEIAFKYINQAMDQLKMNADSEKDLTLLQSMLLGKEMDISEVTVMVADMLFGGVDTTSHTTGFLLYHLARNPEKQEKLFQEIKQIIPSKIDRITPEGFQNLRYLKACLKESIRLHPILRGIQRVLDHDVVINGYRVPAGVTIHCGLQVIYRNDKYFKDPNDFVPERWLIKDKDMNPYAYIPFGFGTRSCIGRRLAELEVLCLSAMLIRNFQLEYHQEDINMLTRLINVPDKPLKFIFLDR